MTAIYIRADGCEVGSWPVPPPKIEGWIPGHPYADSKLRPQAEAQLKWAATHGADMAWHISEILAKNPKAVIAIYARPKDTK